MPLFPRGGNRERDLDDEIDAHLALEARERIASGETPDAAARGARRAFGSVAFAKEATRDAWGYRWAESVAQDLRYACRLMRKAPGFSAVAILTLAIGIGANTAIFGVVDAALLRPLPFPDSDRLVRVWTTRTGVPVGGPSPMDARDLAAARSLEGLVVYDRWRKNVSGLGGSREAEEMVVGLVPGTYFDLLRVTPVLGRVFTEGENVYGRHYVAVISESLWRTRFAADPKIVGRTLRINDESYTITGVVPDVVPSWMDQTSAPVVLWTPFASPDFWTESNRGRGRGLSSLARLRAGFTYDQARAELTTLAAQLARDHPVDRGLGVEIERLVDTRAGPVRPVLLMLCGAVAAVLLIACANLAGLLLARNSVRAREFAVRAALGAGRWRLLRQLLFETLVMSFVGGAVGFGLASAASFAFARIKPGLPYTTATNALSHFWSAGLDGRVLAFTLAVSVVTALAFGLAPALTGIRVSITETLKEGGRSGTAGAGRQRFRRGLVIGEVALTLVLVVAAALLVQTMVRLTHRNPGFRTDHLLLGHIYVPPARYPDADAITRFCTAFGDRLRAVPGVLDVTIATGFPPASPWRQMFTIPGQPISRREDVPTTTFVAADAHFVGTLGLTLLRGRELEDSDTAATRPVALINQAFARRYFPAQDPVGLVIRPGPPSGISSTPLENFGSSTAEITIVGVIRDFMNDGLERPPAPQIFMLFRQLPGLNFGFKDIVVRTSPNPESLGPAVARELKELDTDIPLGEVQTMEAHLRSQAADTRFTTMLLGLFAAISVALAIIGAYGIVSYLVAQRTHELGVRLALGARSVDILWLVLRSSLSIGLWGVLLGLGGAFAVHQSLAELLYGVTASDPSTLAAAATLLLLVVVTASVVPGMRAMHIDPVQALRAE